MLQIGCRGYNLGCRLRIRAFDRVEDRRQLAIQSDKVPPRTALDAEKEAVESSQRIGYLTCLCTCALGPQYASALAHLAERREITPDRVVHAYPNVVLQPESGFGNLDARIHLHGERL